MKIRSGIAWGPVISIVLASAIALLTIFGGGAALGADPSPTPSSGGCVWDPNCGSLVPGEPTPSPSPTPHPDEMLTPPPEEDATETAVPEETKEPNESPRKPSEDRDGSAGGKAEGDDRDASASPDGSSSSAPPDVQAIGPSDYSPQGWSTDVPAFSVLPGPRSTVQILALLEKKGIVAEKAARILAPFPVFGPAVYSNDWHAPRYTPSFHVHEGTDIFAARGTPLLASADGTVSRVTPISAVGGTSLWITGKDGTGYYYAHLDRIAAGVQAGMSVRVGDLVGYVGNTGNAAGGAPHLHFEVHPKMGEAVPPLPYLDTWLHHALLKAKGQAGGEAPTKLGSPELVTGWIPAPPVDADVPGSLATTLSVMPVANRTGQTSKGTWPTILTLLIPPVVALRSRRRLDLRRIWQEFR